MTIKKKILITGASSPILKKLIEKIDKGKYDVCAVTRNKRSLQFSNIDIAEGNFCNPVFANELLKGVQIVIHAAAVTHSYNKKDYLDINLEGTKILVDSSKINEVKKFVFVSSRTAVMESGAYGYSKLQAEAYLRENLDNWLVLRPAEVYGGNTSKGIDKLIEDICNRTWVICPLSVDNKLYPIYINDVVDIFYDLIFVKEKNKEIVTINGKSWVYIL